ncbi:MAG: nucleotidyltransferase domain-containing protein [Myxococcota bacterium]
MIDLNTRTVLLVIGGSRAYGLHRSTSDVDVKGACVPPRATVMGLFERFEQVDDARALGPVAAWLSPEERNVGKVEGAIYDARKVLRLATYANPNILDLLFCREDEIRHATDLGTAIREIRHLFITQKTQATFAGYAHAQLKRIRNHRSWLLHPPRTQPTRAAFGLPEVAVVPKAQRDAAQAAITKQLDAWKIDLEGLDESHKIEVKTAMAEVLGSITSALGYGTDPEEGPWIAAARTVGLDDNLIEALRAERAFRSAQQHFSNYQRWTKERNPARAALEATHGYDTKHGSHLVRLLRMAGEIIETGKVHVWRGPSPDGPADHEELRAIRSGAWSFDELIEWSDAQTKRLRIVVEQGKSVVPAGPDRAAIDAFAQAWLTRALSEHP